MCLTNCLEKFRRSIFLLKKHGIFFVLTSMLILIFVYLFSNISSIGLHGDESWLGLKGINYLQSGHIDRPYGMNKYTGIFQAFCNSRVFKYFGFGIIQLRITGIVLNFLSILCLSLFLVRRKLIKEALIFLMLFSQSVLYMNYAKVSWEVCSFTLFFMVLSAMSLFLFINSSGKKVFLWTFLFLLSTLAGSYNHIIFSSVIVAAFFALFFWIFVPNSQQYHDIDKMFSIVFVAFINICFLYVFMNNYADIVWKAHHYFFAFIFFVLLIFESCIIFKIRKIILYLLKFLERFQLSDQFISLIALFIFASFLFFHGFSFWDTIVQRIVFIRIFSYEISDFQKIFFIITGSAIFIYFVYTLFYNLKNKDFMSCFIIFYMGTIVLYTRQESIRYYLILTVLMFLYIAFNIVKDTAVLKVSLIIFIAANIVLSQCILWKIESNPERDLHAYHFKFGRSSTGISAHFMPFEPVIRYCEAAQIGNISTKEKFFIGNNFRFYKEVYPELKKYTGNASVEYDFKDYGTGFIIKKE